MSATIKYKGNTIATITTDSSKTLKTSGKYCESDIVVENVQDGGSGKATIETFCADNIANQFLCDTWSPSTSVKLAPKYSYNGTVLPPLPAETLAEYPYAWIRKHIANDQYQLIFGKEPWYYNNSGLYCSVDANEPWYNITISTASGAIEWEFYKDTTGYFSVDDARPVIWSNHDIPNGSATATEIYFEGSEPVLVEASDN